MPADKNPWFDTDPGRDTQDHVFLLSCVEAQRYFQDNAARVCLITKHARLDADTAGITDSGYGTGPNVWWLRSPGCDRAHAAAVNSDGSIGWGMVYPNGYGVRPAIRVRLI